MKAAAIQCMWRKVVGVPYLFVLLLMVACTAPNPAITAPASEPVSRPDNESVKSVEVQAASQPAWNNEGEHSEDLLITLRSSRALMKEGESAQINASANNLSGNLLPVNLVLQLGNGLILSSSTSCTGDPCTGRFDVLPGQQALMSVLIQSSGPVAQSYSVILHYSYPDAKTGTLIKGEVEGLISASKYVVARVPNSDPTVPPSMGTRGPRSTRTLNSNLVPVPTLTHTPVTTSTAVVVPTTTPLPPVNGLISYVTSDGTGRGTSLVMSDEKGQNIRQLVDPDPHFPGGYSWSPDGASLIYRCGQGVCLADSDGSNIRAVSTVPNGSGFEWVDMFWSPDGRKIGIAGSSRGCSHTSLSMIDVVGGYEFYELNALPNCAIARGPYAGPAWSPDGTMLAYVIGRETLTVTETKFLNAQGSISHVAESLWAGRRLNGFSWSPDSRRIAVATHNSVIIIELGTEQNQKANDFDRSTLLFDDTIEESRDIGYIQGPPEWSPDSRFIAYVRNTGNRIQLPSTNFENLGDLYIVEVNTGTETRLTTEEDIVDPQVSWSPDGSLLAYISLRQYEGGTSELRGISLVGVDGKTPYHLTKGSTVLGVIKWQPGQTRRSK